MIDTNIAGGIATLVWNVTDRPMNVFNPATTDAFEKAVRGVLADASVVGVIITSSKKELVVGADLETLRGITDPALAMRIAGRLSVLFREIERAKKPFVAAINGSALGGGYEMCLACHRRIAANEQKTRIGLPEVTLGLLPGAGGTQRLPRMIGVKRALPYLLEGRMISVEKALENGLVDEVVPSSELLARAKEWLLTEGPKNLVKPWDAKGFTLPGGAVQSAPSWQLFSVVAASLCIKTNNLYPAPGTILEAVYDGCHVDIDAGLRIENRKFAKLAISKEAQNLIRTSFFAINEVKKLAGRPTGVPVQTYRTIGVLGAGMMGAGIAHVAAAAGLEVVLLDQTLEAAERGKARLTASPETLARIQPTTDYERLSKADIVIEAVFEDRAVKARVTKSAEAALPKDSLFASNTSTLPITGLAESSRSPEQFVGLHFFSPVERMPLVEVIRGARTSDATIARAMDFVARIGKTPIVVADGRAFFTSRVFGTYVYEGMAMLHEGIHPALIERAGVDAGMPMPPLALMDEITLELMHSVMRQTAADLGDRYEPQPQDPVLIEMVEKQRRMGRKAGGGFYTYGEGGKKELWSELSRLFPRAAQQPEVGEVKRRLMFIQSVEAARCLEQNLVSSRDADVGSILGWGFPAFLGGVVSQIDTVGVSAFIAACDELAKKYGPRFAPPALLRARADAHAAE